MTVVRNAHRAAVHAEIERIESRRKAILCALPNPITRAIWQRVEAEGPQSQTDWDEVLEQVFASWALDDEDPAFCFDCLEPMSAHEEVEREGSYDSGPVLFLVCPEEL